MPDSLDAHYNTVIRSITKGRVVPFLGAGVNLYDRPAKENWQHGQADCLPSGDELAEYLADNFDFPSSETQVSCPCCKSEVPLPQDLTRVSQHVAVMNGTGPLYDELHDLLDADFPPTSLHQFLASLPTILRDKDYSHPYQLIVTTNYDDVLERAFQDADESFDLVYYLADGEHRGKFLHKSPNSEANVIEKPNEYRGLSLDRRSVILKIHGAIDRATEEEDREDREDSFVITEDHYIDYLTRTEIVNLIPCKLLAKLKNSHLLFMGYSLRDWNLRVILHRIWRERKLSYKSWAIQITPSEIDREFWNKRNVEIFGLPLEDYITTLDNRLQAVPPAGGAS